MPKKSSVGSVLQDTFIFSNMDELQTALDVVADVTDANDTSTILVNQGEMVLELYLETLTDFSTVYNISFRQR